jgi:hypothetical protein
MTTETEMRVLRIAGATAIIGILLGLGSLFFGNMMSEDPFAAVMLTTATALPLHCIHPNQSAHVNQDVNFEADGGTTVIAYSWTDAKSGAPLSTERTFTTRFTTAGAYQVILHRGTQTATCTVFVDLTTNSPTPSPTPPPTPTPTTTALTCIPKLQTISQNASASFSVVGQVPTKKITWYTSAGRPHYGVGTSFVSIFSKLGKFPIVAHQGSKSSTCKVQVVK